MNRKYAALPDLDSAPDIYETPDLTDDNSTIPTTTGPSQSDDELDEDVDEDADGISRSRLRVDQARSRFMPSQVDAQGVDFSDRLNSKRQSYRTSSRRQRILEDGTRQIGDLSDDEDGEDLERKIARLKREIEETKQELGKQQAESQATSSDTHDTELVSLSRALEDMSPVPKTTPMSRKRIAEPMTENSEDAKAEKGTGTSEGATYTVTYSPSYEQSHALAKAADFDRRLMLLEKAIGISSADLADLQGGAIIPRAIIPSIDALSKQILTLSEATPSSLDSISRRVRTLTQEADQLEKSQKSAKAAQEASKSSNQPTTDLDDSEQVSKVNALYGTLPTIENLTPLLPPLLDRLRSLRAIHADAAAASEVLERIEASQSDMASEITQWREGLEKIEDAMEEGQEAMAENMKTVEGWVKAIETRVSKLS